MCTYDTTMAVCIPHMKSLKTIMWPGALAYIYLTLLADSLNKYAYDIAHIFPHCIITVVYIQDSHSVKTNSLHLLFAMLCHRCANNNYATYMLSMKISSCVGMRQLCQYTYLIWTDCNINVTRKLVYIHFAILAYTNKEICLSYCTHMSDCISTVPYI